MTSVRGIHVRPIPNQIPNINMLLWSHSRSRGSRRFNEPFGSAQATVTVMTASASVQPSGLFVCYAICFVVMVMAVSMRSISSRRDRGKSGSDGAWIYVALVCVRCSPVPISQLIWLGIRYAVLCCWLRNNLPRDRVASTQRHLRGPSISFPVPWFHLY